MPARQAAAQSGHPVLQAISKADLRSIIRNLQFKAGPDFQDHGREQGAHRLRSVRMYRPSKSKE